MRRPECSQEEMSFEGHVGTPGLKKCIEILPVPGIYKGSEVQEHMRYLGNDKYWEHIVLSRRMSAGR